MMDLIIAVISGVSVFILSQLFIEFILRPLQEYKVLKGRIAKYLILYANLYTNPITRIGDKEITEYREGSNAVRILASEIEAYAQTKPPQALLFFIVPTKKILKSVSRELIGISNCFFATSGCAIDARRTVTACRDNIRKMLKINQ